MAMILGDDDLEGSDALINEINTTPLVDVMLVLLIIFLITVPVVNSSLMVKLPKRAIEHNETSQQVVVVSVGADGQTYWNTELVREQGELLRRLRGLHAQSPNANVHIHGDRAGSYLGIGRVIAACQAAGVFRISLVTSPGVGT